VLTSLQLIETCGTFAEFVKAFSQFGNDMVQLAHLSGDRQNVSIVHVDGTYSVSLGVHCSL